MNTIAEDLDAQIAAHCHMKGSRPVLIVLGRMETAGLKLTHPLSVTHHDYQGISLEERDQASLVLLIGSGRH